MKIFAKVEYLGTNYCGWQIQPNGISVEENIEKVLSKILNQNINIIGSGRTDAGVHAYGQTFHFEADVKMELQRLKYSTNQLLPKDIHIIEFKEVDNDFHARYSAKGKHYRYVINLGEESVFSSGLVCEHQGNVDINKFKESLELFIGQHNYQDFTSKEEDESMFIRNIFKIELIESNNILNIDLYADGFMRYMIRYIIGTSIMVATGKESIDYIKKHLDSKERKIVQYKAPSEGLYLIDVIY